MRFSRHFVRNALVSLICTCVYAAHLRGNEARLNARERPRQDHSSTLIGGKQMAAKRMTKSQIVGEISEKTSLSKKEVSAVFEGLRDLVKRELGKKGPGEFVIPDLLKLRIRNVPAKKERRGIDPFTKQERLFPAKPAQRKVRATALKKLKDLIAK